MPVDLSTFNSKHSSNSMCNFDQQNANHIRSCNNKVVNIPNNDNPQNLISSNNDSKNDFSTNSEQARSQNKTILNKFPLQQSPIKRHKARSSSADDACSLDRRIHREELFGNLSKTNKVSLNKAETNITSLIHNLNNNIINSNLSKTPFGTDTKCKGFFQNAIFI